MTTAEYNQMSDSEKQKEDWMNSKWRPMMGWMYMVVCIADFVLFPVLWSVVQVIADGKVESQWQPITLQGAGLFHMAMGAVLGLAAWGRTQEKMAGANNGGISSSVSGPSTFSVPSTGSFAPAGNFSSPPASSFSTAKPTTSFSAAPAPVAMSGNGKPMPIFTDDREL